MMIMEWLRQVWSWLRQLPPTLNGLVGVGAVGLVVAVFALVARLVGIEAKWVALAGAFVFLGWIVVVAITQLPAIRAAKLGLLPEFIAWSVVALALCSMLFTVTSLFLGWPDFPRNIFFSSSEAPRHEFGNQEFLSGKSYFASNYLKEFANIHVSDRQSDALERKELLKYMAKGMLPRESIVDERAVVCVFDIPKNFVSINATLSARGGMDYEGACVLVRNPETAPVFYPAKLTLSESVKRVDVERPSAGDQLVLFLKVKGGSIDKNTPKSPDYFELAIRGQ